MRRRGDGRSCEMDQLWKGERMFKMNRLLVALFLPLAVVLTSIPINSPDAAAQNPQPLAGVDARGAQDQRARGARNARADDRPRRNVARNDRKLWRHRPLRSATQSERSGRRHLSGADPDVRRRLAERTGDLLLRRL